MEPRLSHLFCCRSGAAKHEEGGVRGRFLPRHPARTWSPESARSSSPHLAVADQEALHRRGGGGGERRHPRCACASGAALWCGVHGLMAMRFSVSPAHRSADAEAVGWDLAQFNVGCLTQRRCSFRSKEQEQNKSWMLKTWHWQ